MLILTILIPILTATAASPVPVPTAQPSVTAEVEESPWKKACAAVATQQVRKKDLPTDAEKAELEGCDPKKLYYGIGIPEDRKKARLCALLGKRGDDVFTNEVILMMVYANGFGAKKDLSLATKLACDLEANRTERASRVEHLLALKGQTDADVFDFCDDAVGILTEERCGALTEEIVQARREAELKRVSSKWSDAEKKALEELKRGVEAFAELRSQREVDLSGEGKAAIQVQSEGEFMTAFLHALEDFEEGRLPAGKKEDLKKAKSEMESAFEAIVEDEEYYHGTVERDDVRDVQKKWNDYREAWLKFVSVRYPKGSRDGWETWLYRERAQQLRSLGHYDF